MAGPAGGFGNRVGGVEAPIEFVRIGETSVVPGNASGEQPAKLAFVLLCRNPRSFGRVVHAPRALPVFCAEIVLKLGRAFASIVQNSGGAACVAPAELCRKGRSCRAYCLGVISKQLPFFNGSVW
jgi:hypothetical protein